jgi:hypothetical protein
MTFSIIASINGDLITKESRKLSTVPLLTDELIGQVVLVKYAQLFVAFAHVAYHANHHNLRDPLEGDQMLWRTTLRKKIITLHLIITGLTFLLPAICEIRDAVCFGMMLGTLLRVASRRNHKRSNAYSRRCLHDRCRRLGYGRLLCSN